MLINICQIIIFLFNSYCILLSFSLIKGRIVLNLPSIEVLAEAAATPTRRAAVLHVLETTVIGWIKQIRVSIMGHGSSTHLGHTGHIRLVYL